MKALPLMAITSIRVQQGRFREAMDALEDAMDADPGWSEPYFRMADLLVLASTFCDDLSGFERKAVFWAAMDYVELARQADPGCEEEAGIRMFSLRERAPSEEEALFHGLKHGDTVPIRCWFDTITTVKIN